ncbi:MAG: hypothetical protein J0L82_12215 [Deltaproteobacteria bacterium]|nr:hypothetical protein [Deltaproteobacteria bacterium]
MQFSLIAAFIFFVSQLSQLAVAETELGVNTRFRSVMTLETAFILDENLSAMDTDELTKIDDFERKIFSSSKSVANFLFGPLFVDGGYKPRLGAVSQFTAQSLDCGTSSTQADLQKCRLTIRLLPQTITVLPPGGRLNQAVSKVYYIRYFFDFELRFAKPSGSYELAGPMKVSKNSIELTDQNGLEKKSCFIATMPGAGPQVCL